MKLIKERLNDLRFLGSMVDAQPIALHTQFGSAYTLNDPEKNRDAHVELHWTGFQLMNLDVDVAKLLSTMGCGPWSISAGAMLTMDGVFFDSVEKENINPGLPIATSDLDEIGRFVCKVLKDVYGLVQPVLTEFQQVKIGDREDGKGKAASFYFSITTPCTKESWDRAKILAESQAKAAEKFEKFVTEVPVESEVRNVTGVSNKHLH